MALKWNHSFTRHNRILHKAERVREMYFQDHKSAQELVDVDNKIMTFREVGSNKLLGYAHRNKKRQWICTRVVVTEAFPMTRYWAPTKELAVDFLLGREVPLQNL